MRNMPLQSVKEAILKHLDNLSAEEWALFRSSTSESELSKAAVVEKYTEQACLPAMAVLRLYSDYEQVATIENSPLYYFPVPGVYLWSYTPEQSIMLWLTWPNYPVKW